MRNDGLSELAGLIAGEIVPVAIYGFIGMVLLFIAGIVNDRVVLHKFSNQKEIIESSNTAVAHNTLPPVSLFAAKLTF